MLVAGNVTSARTRGPRHLITSVKALHGSVPHNKGATALVAGCRANLRQDGQTDHPLSRLWRWAAPLRSAEAGRVLVTKVPKRPYTAHFPISEFALDLQ